MKNDSLRKNGFLKVFGVLVLVVLCALSCFFGYIQLYLSYSDNADTFLDTVECYNSLMDEGYNVVDQLLYSTDENTEYPGNMHVRIERYDGLEWATVENRIVKNDNQYDHMFRGLYYVYDEGNSGYDEYWIDSWYYPGKLQIEQEGLYDGQCAYVVTIALDNPEIATDLFYEEFNFYEDIRACVDIALPVLIGSLWMALVIIILELTAAGHKKGYDGIYLSWFDRIPFDLLTVVIGICVAGAVALGICYFETNHGFNVRYFINLLTPVSCIEIACLLLYYYLCSVAVRIKSHTLFSNNVIILIFSRIYDFFYKLFLPLKEAPKWWLMTVITGYGIGIFGLFASLDVTGVFGLVLIAVAAVAGYAMLQSGKDMMVLLEAVRNLSSGHLDYRIDDGRLNDMKGPFYQMGKSLDEIGTAMETAVSEKMKSERMKTELITNVSHDLKTPLTSIINYVDLLKKDHTEEQGKEYLEVLDRQSQRLKRLTEDVVEASKASTGNIQVDMQAIGVREILDQAIAEYEDKINAADLKVIRSMSDEQLKAMADGRLLWRVVRNLLSNICKYALPGTRVYIDVMKRGTKVSITFKNTSKEELNISADELKERFVRGDSSRHVEGSGLGLSIVESLMKVMNGECNITVDGDLFKAELILEQTE